MQKSLMRQLRTILLAGVLTFSIFSIALSETATKDEMTIVCHNWLAYITFHNGSWAGSSSPILGESEDIIVNDTLLGRYFPIEPSGYIIVPNLKEMAPIKAYSEDCRLDFSAEDGFAALIKEVLQDRIRLFVQSYGSMEAIQPSKGEVLFGPEQRAAWDTYLVSPDVFKAGLKSGLAKVEDIYGPLLTSSWDQGHPYNLKCPWGDGARTVVGCVATAAAQILAYHKWPPEGTGTHSYYWSGDNSCDGSTSGAILTADYTDPYDWENILDHYGSSSTYEQQQAVAELCYEVGVAFNMDYGACGSGAYTADAQNVFPDHFRYYDHIEKHDRTDYALSAWSEMIRDEIQSNRPIQYRISSHSIVCDGWRVVDPLLQVHMNYGWDDGHNAWYTIDNLYCNWSGCSWLVEYMMTHIEPDRGVQFTADTTWGFVPLSVQFTGSSPLVVDQWIWDFGDGDSAFVQSPEHVYESAGRFNVRLRIVAGTEIREYYAVNYIAALNDSLTGDDAQGKPDSSFALTIYARNTTPLRKIQIPINYGGPINLILDSFSTEGCRSSVFDTAKYTHYDVDNYRVTISMYNLNPGSMDMEPGYGPVLKLYFTIPGSSPMNDSNIVSFEPYKTYSPIFYSNVADFTPKLDAGAISVAYICGNANGDAAVNALDITFIINYLYKGGNAPVPIMAGDANGNGAVNALDITYLINFLYKGGSAPVCP
jgi:hypothetical protein